MQSGIVNEVREPLFDTYEAAAGAVLPSTINLFVNGQSDTKGPELTNMTGDGELPSPERMKVYGIRLGFFGTTDTDIEKIIKGYCVVLKVSGRPQFTAPIEYCNAGSGINGKSQNGVPDARAGVMFPDEFVVDIAAGQKFALQLVSKSGVALSAPAPDPAAGTGLFLRAMLDGLHTLPV